MENQGGGEMSKNTDILKLLSSKSPADRAYEFRKKMQEAKKNNPIAYKSYLGLTLKPKKKGQTK